MLQHLEHREVCSLSERLCGTKARCPGSTDPVTVIKTFGGIGKHEAWDEGMSSPREMSAELSAPYSTSRNTSAPRCQLLQWHKRSQKKVLRVLCLPPGSLPGPTGTPAPALQHRSSMIWGRPAELTTQEAKRRIEDLLNYQDLSSEGCSGETRGTSSSPQPSP